MQTVDPLIEDDGGPNDSLFLEVMDRLEPVLDEIRGKLKKRLEKDPAFFQSPKHKASQNACYTTPRSKGGQCGALAGRYRLETNRSVHLNSFMGPLPKGVKIEVSEKWLQNNWNRPFVNFEDDFDFHIANLEPVTEKVDKIDLERKSLETEFVGMKWSVAAPRPCLAVLPDGGGGAAWALTKGVEQNVHNSLYDEYGRHYDWTNRPKIWAYADTVSRGGVLHAKIQAVREPLKVRVISKGEAAPYYFAKSLQTALHDIMRQMDCFRLIGRSVCPTDILDIAEFGEDQFWLSGDYKATTDMISARLGNEVLDQLTLDFDDKSREIYRAVLAPHFCVYPEVYIMRTIDGKEICVTEEVEPVMQTNGQLMGSILSFVILCLVNLGLCLAVKLRGMKLGVELPRRKKIVDRVRRKLLINGDDTLYAGTMRQFELHCELGAGVGLEMSVGKTYVHSSYANINSLSFDCDLRRTASSCKAIPFLNSGLFFGQNKVMGVLTEEEMEVTEQSKCSVINTMLEGSYKAADQAALLGSYLSLHRDDIAREQKGRSLFIHPSLGGLGVKRPEGFKIFFNGPQLILAKTLLSNPCIQPAERPRRYAECMTPSLHPPPVRYVAKKESQHKRGRSGGSKSIPLPQPKSNRYSWKVFTERLIKGVCLTKERAAKSPAGFDNLPMQSFML
jgi:hypothetical protein